MAAFRTVLNVFNTLGQDGSNKQKIQEEVEREEQQEYCRFFNFMDIAQWVHCYKAYGKMGTRRA